MDETTHIEGAQTIEIKPQVNMPDKIVVEIPGIEKIKGDKGEKGDKGDKGDTGEGKDGYTPIKGKDYFDGKDGESITGPAGPIGPQGPKGDAKVGPRGPAGSPDTGEDIVAKVHGLAKGKRLNYDLLDNLPDLEQIIRLSRQASKTPSLVELDDVNLDGLTKTNGKYNLGSGSGTGGAWGTITGTLSNQTDLQAALDAKISSIADPDANVLFGWDDTDNEYKFITLGSGLVYTHSTHTLSSTGGGGGSVAWGAITGTLSDQTDLQSALDAKQASDAGLTSLAGLVYAATAFVKMTGADTFALDTNTYLTSLSGAVLTDQTVGQTIGATGARLTKLWATDITVTNAITGSVTGNAGTVTGATFTTALTVNGGTLTLTANAANTSVLTIGAGAVSVSGSNTGDQTNISGNAATVTVADAGADTTTWVLLGTSQTGSLAPATDAGLTYNASTNALTATTFVGALTGNADTATTAAAWTTARNLAGNSVNGSANVAFANKFIVQGTTDAGLSAAQFLGALGTGIVKNTTTTGVLSIAVAGDFPTLNQNTTGSAATLTTPRTIGGVSFDGSANITVASATGGFTVSGGDLAIGANNLTITGSIGSTGSRVTKGWFTDLQVTNAIAGSITGNAATATALATARAINGVNFDGTAAITVTAAAGTLTGTTLAATVVTSSLTAVGDLTTGSIGTGFVVKGVTMTLGSDANYDIYYRNSSGVLTRLANGTTGQLLTATTSNAPSWVAPATNGTVTTVSVVSANGFAGSVANATTTPAITLTTSITGTLQGNGTAISASKVTLTQPASGSTLTILDGKTLIVNKTLTLDGTDSTTMTFPSTSATIARTDAGQTFTGVQTMTSPALTTPAITGLATGSGVASAATASTLASRDANANLAANNHLSGFTTTATAAGTTTLTVGSTQIQEFTGSTTQTVTLPVVSTLVLGQSFIIINRSSGVVTVNSSGGNAVQAVAATSSVEVTCVLVTGTTAASWDAVYTTAAAGSGTVTSVSVVSANGFAGSVANATTTPAITLTTSITGTLQGNGTAISASKVTLTQPATGSTLTILDGKTLTVNKTITLDGTDSTTMTFPSTSATIARTDAANTFTGVQTMTSPALTTPAITGLATGSGVASAATVSTLMTRDANGIANVISMITGWATTATAAGTTTLVVGDKFQQYFTGTLTQTVKLPTTSIVAGQQYQIVNNSTGAVTVQSSGANTILILAASTSAVFTALVATPTTAANWGYTYQALVASSSYSLALTGGSVTIAGGGSNVYTFPAATDTLVGLASTDDLTNKRITLAAGSAAVSALQFASGTNRTTATAGALEYDGLVFYSSPVASARGVSPSIMYSIVPAGDFTLSAASGVQSAFPTTGDVWTLSASTTYEFWGQYHITTGTTAHTTAMAFATGGGASITSINYFVTASNGQDNAYGSANIGDTWVSTNSSTIVTGSVTTGAGHYIYFRGLIRMNAAGTITPQIAFSSNPTGTNLMKADSYICFMPLGTNTNNLLGNVG